MSEHRDAPYNMAAVLEEIHGVQSQSLGDASRDATICLLNGREFRGHVEIHGVHVRLWERIDSEDGIVLKNDKGTCEIPIHTHVSHILWAAFSERD